MCAMCYVRCARASVWIYLHMHFLGLTFARIYSCFANTRARRQQTKFKPPLHEESPTTLTMACRRCKTVSEETNTVVNQFLCTLKLLVLRYRRRCGMICLHNIQYSRFFLRSTSRVSRIFRKYLLLFKILLPRSASKILTKNLSCCIRKSNPESSHKIRRHQNPTYTAT
jgi:hypothetical protein